jgi:hypothetical protein
MRNTSTGPGFSGAPLSVPAATSEIALEISAEGRDEPVVINLPEVKARTPFLGGRTSGIPELGAGIPSTPAARKDLGDLVSRVGGLRLGNKSVWFD